MCTVASTIPHITNHHISTVVRIVAKKIVNAYPDAVDYDEATGWSQLGVAKAIKKFNPERFAGETLDPVKRICAYMICKGYRAAQDEMRYAHVIARFRDDRWYGMTVPTESYMGVVDSKTGRFVVAEPVDASGKDPADSVAIKDFMDVFPESLSTAERRVFELRYRENKKLREIARILDVTFTRIYHLNKKLEAKICEHFGQTPSSSCPNFMSADVASAVA
jgi:RNA polymerase sigma factor (sigma-70 family)